MRSVGVLLAAFMMYGVVTYGFMRAFERDTEAFMQWAQKEAASHSAGATVNLLSRKPPLPEVEYPMLIASAAGFLPWGLWMAPGGKRRVDWVLMGVFATFVALEALSAYWGSPGMLRASVRPLTVTLIGSIAGYYGGTALSLYSRRWRMARETAG